MKVGARALATSMFTLHKCCRLNVVVCWRRMRPAWRDLLIPSAYNWDRLWLDAKPTHEPILSFSTRSSQPRNSKANDIIAHSHLNIRHQRNHGDRIDRPERARFPEAASHFPQLKAPERKDQESRKGWPEMVQGRWSGIQDAQECH